jgi:hypothetical protein
MSRWFRNMIFHWRRAGVLIGVFSLGVLGGLLIGPRRSDSKASLAAPRATQACNAVTATSSVANGFADANLAALRSEVAATVRNELQNALKPAHADSRLNVTAPPVPTREQEAASSAATNAVQSALRMRVWTRQDADQLGLLVNQMATADVDEVLSSLARAINSGDVTVTFPGALL